MVLNILGALASIAGAFIPETVTTTGGVLALRFLMPFAAAGFFTRAIGIGIAMRQGRGTMGWTARVTSWIFFGAIGGSLGASGSAAAIAGLAAFIVLDASAGLVQREYAAGPPRKKRMGIWRRMRLPLLIGLYLTLVAIIHFSVSIYLPFGVLVTWSLLAFGFTLLLRFQLAGPKATEEMLRAPPTFRRHERREERVTDPERARADDILLRLRAQGDAGPFLELVAQAARTADFSEPEIHALQERLLASFARAGTRRDEDMHAALAEVERVLSPSNRAGTPRPTTP